MQEKYQLKLQSVNIVKWINVNIWHLQLQASFIRRIQGLILAFLYTYVFCSYTHTTLEVHCEKEFGFALPLFFLTAIWTVVGIKYSPKHAIELDENGRLIFLSGYS